MPCLFFLDFYCLGKDMHDYSTCKDEKIQNVLIKVIKLPMLTVWKEWPYYLPCQSQRH